MKKALYLVVLVLFALSVSVLLYILLGVEGNAWSSTALRIVIWASHGIFLSGVLFSFFQFSRYHLLIHIIFALFIAFGYLIGSIGCFPGTGSRLTNCGVDIFALIGVANVAVICLMNRSQFIQFISVFVICFPLVTIAAYFYLTVPLWAMLHGFDLEKTCIVQFEPGGVAPVKYYRVGKISDVKPGLFVGETAPRLAKIERRKWILWEYSRRQFGRTYEGNLLELCG